MFQSSMFLAIKIATELCNNDHNNTSRSGDCCCRKAQWLPDLREAEFSDAISILAATLG